PQAIFAAFVVAALAIGVWDGLQHAFLAAVFPVTVGSLMLVPALWVLWGLATGHGSAALNYDHEVLGEHAGRREIAGPWYYVWWLFGFLAACMLFGFLIAMVAFFVLFLRLEAQA